MTIGLYSPPKPSPAIKYRKQRGKWEYSRDEVTWKAVTSPSTLRLLEKKAAPSRAATTLEDYRKSQSKEIF